MLFRAFLITTTLFLSSLVNADVKLTNLNANTYSTASGKFFKQVNATATYVYGGLAGTDCGPSTTANTVCDSCPTSPAAACNSKRIYDDLNFEITIQYTQSTTTTTTVSRQVFATNDVDSSSGQSPLVLTYPTAFVTPNNAVTIKIKWHEICNFLGSPSSGGCSGAIPTTSKAIRFGVDADGSNGLNGEGTEYIVIRFSVLDLASAASTNFCNKSDTTFTSACNFQIYPGDEKVYIENVLAGSSFPTVDGTTASSVRVFYQKQNLGLPSQTTTTHVDLPIATSSASGNPKIISLSKNEISGLENDVPYLFNIGIVDIANNVGLVGQSTGTAATTKGDFSDCYDVTGAESFNVNCHYAVPSKVTGLSSDEFDCFITTATYGSPFKPKVQIFRKFRNQYLKTNLLGRKIIQTYYKYSPPLARWISSHPSSKAYVRILLWPLWFVAKICVDFPSLLLIFFFSLVVLLRRKNKELF
jgi:hypothetical protein